MPNPDVYSVNIYINGYANVYLSNLKFLEVLLRHLCYDYTPYVHAHARTRRHCGT